MQHPSFSWTVKMPPNVFLSVGQTFTADQERFVARFEDYLRANGLNPQTVGRSYIKNQQPLKSVAECMRICQGTVVLAFERIHIAHGQEKRGGSDETIVKDTNLTTVWNHIEAAIAYTLGHPLLVVVERGTRGEGLIEKGYDWYVKTVDLSVAAFGDPEFAGLIADWKDHVSSPEHALLRSASTPDATDLSQLGIGALLSRIRPGHLKATIAALATVVGGAFVIGYQLGNKWH
jgi:hypothetical protein